MQGLKESFTQYLEDRGIKGDEIRLDVIHDFLDLIYMPALISVPDAGILLGVSQDTAYLMARRGQLPIVHVTGPGRKRYMVNTKKFLEMLEDE